MLATFWELAVQTLRKLYVRVILIAALSLVAVALAKVLGAAIPEGLAERIGAGAVDPILATLATSMLAVTTFSLTMMTAAHQTAAGQFSPRTHVILKDDTVTHSVLAVFVGAYLFALSAIVLRNTPFIGERESVALFGMTLVVIAMIVISMIRWIAHLEDLGSLDYTLAQVEARAAHALRAIGAEPCHGAGVLNGSRVPTDFATVRARRAGYVQQVFHDMLQTEAQSHDARVEVLVLAGDYVQEGQVLARILPESAGAAMRKEVQEAIQIRPNRTFVQDPGFGVSVMAEIACRALSPGINDSVTAVTVVDRLSSLLLLADPGAEAAEDGEAGRGRLDRVAAPKLPLEALFVDSFDRIWRDGAAKAEVAQAVHRALEAIAERGHGELARAAAACARRCRSEPGA